MQTGKTTHLKTPPDPEPDWERSHERKVKIYRLLIIGHIWSIVASAIGFIFLLWLFLR